MPQYKHKKTGNVVFEYKVHFQEQTVYGPKDAMKDIYSSVLFIPKWVVEESSDWEKSKRFF